MDTTICSVCLLPKPIANFRSRSGNRLRSKVCGPCEYEAWQAAGRCPRCKNPVVGVCERCAQWRQERQVAARRSVIEHYGGACKWCKQDIDMFLTIDHINADGKSAHGVGGTRRWRKIITNGFQTDLRILCHNCNSGRAMYGDEAIQTAVGDTSESMICRGGLSRYQLRNIKDKAAVLNHYGSRCALCSHGRFVSLTIDHIGGGGRKHRSEVGNSIARWLVSNGFPEGYRTLCWNCNAATHTYGDDVVRAALVDRC